MYALIDGTRFYSQSCSIYKPEQRLVPVLVTAGQGISIAANRAATDLGIGKFEVIWESIDKLELHNGFVYKANFNTLSHISDRFMTCVELNVEGARTYRYSVDELFVSVGHLQNMGVDLDSFIFDLRRKVYKETGVAVGGGVGKTLTLAKVGSWAAKSVPGYNGQCVLTADKVDEILSIMPVGKVWNIGGAYERHLKHEGITTALQLKRCDPKVYQKRYSVNVSNVILELNGVEMLGFTNARQKKKNIWSTSSYRDRLRDADDLFAELAHHCSEVMRKVREQQSEVKVLTVTIGTGVYDKCVPFQKRIDISFEVGVIDTAYALCQLRGVFNKMLPSYLPDQPIYKVGVGATSLVDGDKKQFDLFSQDFDNNEKLNETMDGINAQYGKGALMFGSQKKRYQEKDGDITFSALENYFTDVADLIRVKCQ